ncbi:lasso peptide biosynthesis B2 protein [Luteimonas sp. 3794]|uniref:lasso peptide biosynthesis B2 protein n=1 Tax=Luteimonas sp. 3794 TaxID=2817730 RepID=UPI00285F7010|nr:lasso peptide biosynthesis B2 protein [Luteimonas sp. 3794]MDR6990963.1 hypothetical protein [Luteimonas sp. 3794]
MFLDVMQDRYFRLPPDLERAFANFMDGKQSESTLIDELRRRNILVPGSHGHQVGWTIAEPPARSAMEMLEHPVRLSLATSAEVLLTTLRARRDLKKKPLRHILAALGPQIGGPGTDQLPGLKTQRLLDSAAQFRRARLYAPVAMRCLVDSIAMTRFLRRRGLPAYIVFGVAVNPFSAHCWVQSGDLVLNDSVGNVNAHTVIRVV